MGPRKPSLGLDYHTEVARRPAPIPSRRAGRRTTERADPQGPRAGFVGGGGMGENRQAVRTFEL